MIEHPDLPPDVTAEQLAEITGRYPYFSAAHQLLTRLYQENGDHRFSDQVQQAAVYATDRRKLYNYLKQQSPKVTLRAVQPETDYRDTATVPQSQVAQQTEISVKATDTGAISLAGLIMAEDEVMTELPANTAPPEVIIAPLPQETIVVASQEPETIAPIPVAEKEEIFEPMPAATPDIAAIDPLEKEILLEAMQSSIELEVTPEPAEETQADPNSYAAWIYRRSQRIHFGEQTKTGSADKEEPADVPTPAATRLQQESEETEAPDLRDDDLPAFANRPLSHGLKRLTPPDEKSHQRELIDRFIRLEPNISRGKAAEYSSGNIAKESLEEDFTFVTETMAQLYARQGKPDKARKAYKKLIELYPEKSIYFAAQLKNLEKHKK